MASLLVSAEVHRAVRPLPQFAQDFELVDDERAIVQLPLHNLR